MSLGPTKIFWDIFVPFFLKSTSAAAMVFSQRTLLRRSAENVIASPSQPLLIQPESQVEGFGELCSWLSALTAGQPVHVWLSVTLTNGWMCTCPFLPSDSSIHGSPLSSDLFQSTQYYDMRWSCEHLIMVWINAFVMLTSQLLPSKYCDLLHKSAAHLGKWQKLKHGSYTNAPQHMWVG